MCRGRFFLLNSVTKLLMDLNEARLRCRYSTLPTLRLLPATRLSSSSALHGQVWSHSVQKVCFRPACPRCLNADGGQNVRLAFRIISRCQDHMCSTADQGFDDLKTQTSVASCDDGDLAFEIDFGDQALDIVPFLRVVGNRILYHLVQAFLRPVGLLLCRACLNSSVIGGGESRVLHLTWHNDSGLVHCMHAS